MKRVQAQQQGANWRDQNDPAGAGRGRMVDYYDPATGQNVRRWVPQNELEGSSFEPPL